MLVGFSIVLLIYIFCVNLFLRCLLGFNDLCISGVFFIGDCCLSCALLTFEQQIIFWLIVGLTLDVIIHLSFGYLLVVKKNSIAIMATINQQFIWLMPVKTSLTLREINDMFLQYYNNLFELFELCTLCTQIAFKSVLLFSFYFVNHMNACCSLTNLSWSLTHCCPSVAACNVIYITHLAANYKCRANKFKYIKCIGNNKSRRAQKARRE